MALTPAPILYGLRSGLLLVAISVFGLVHESLDWALTGSCHGPALRHFIEYFVHLPTSVTNLYLIRWLLEVPAFIALLLLGTLVYGLAIEADIRHMRERARRLDLTNRH